MKKRRIIKAASQDFTAGSLKRAGLPRYFEIIRTEGWALIKLGLITFLFSVPVVTLPCALAAACRCFLEMIADRPLFLLHDYWRFFKANFRQSLLLGLFYGVLISLAVLAAYYYMAFASSSNIVFFSIGILMAFSAQIMLHAYFYAMLMLLKTELQMRAIIKNAFLMCVIQDNVKRQFLFFLVEILCIFLAILCYPYLTVLTVCIVCPLALLFMTYFSWLGIEEYVLKKPNGDAADIMV